MKSSRPGKKTSTPEKKTPQRVHFTQIDILKGLAIIAVILMHTYNNDLLFAIGAPFYIWQAVPVFLLLAAFNNACALSSARKTTLVQSYDLTILFHRLKRLADPYVIVWIFQLLVVLFVLASKIDIPLQNPNHFFYNGINAVFNFLSGTNGPGNYFIPLIVQLILLVPLFYWLALRSPNLMLAVAFVLDLVCEFLSVVSGMPTWLYGILITRYIFICALGVWLVFQERVMTQWILIGGLLSALYITAVSYFSFRVWIFSLDPSFFHACAFFWTLVIVVLGFQFLPSDSGNRIVGILTELGKASWHIFLVQMTFFFFLGHVVIMELSVGSVIILALFYLVPCLSIGYGFYRLSEYLSRPEKNSTQ